MVYKVANENSWRLGLGVACKTFLKNFHAQLRWYFLLLPHGKNTNNLMHDLNVNEMYDN